MRWKLATPLVLASCLLLNTAPTYADESSLLIQLRANLVDKPSAVRKSLLPELYGVYFSFNEPRVYVDGKFTYVGNSSTGYSYLSGPRRGQDLNPQESQQLFREFLSAIPREKLIAYRFGSGRRDVFLFTAYDCPTCRALEQAFSKQAKTLDATVYIVPTALRYSMDARAKPLLKGVLCSADPAVAWNDLILKGKAPAPGACPENPDDYAFLSRAFPVKFPSSVPTAVTADGRIYPMVMAKFDELFRAR